MRISSRILFFPKPRMTDTPHQAREFVELAAVLASQGGVVIHRAARLSPSSAEAYWTSSRCRIENWAQAIKKFRRTLQSPTSKRAAWLAFRPWYDEIIISEVLTRVWTALATASDDKHESHRIEPIARSIFVGHLEARQRVLRLFVDERKLDHKVANRFDCVRRNSERWTDMLLGYLMLEHDVTEFAFVPDRVRDFADGLRNERKDEFEHYTWPLVRSSLRTSFGPHKSSVLPNKDLNQEILYSVFGAFGPDFFDAIGSFASLWRCRLDHIANDAEMMIDQLLCEHNPVDRP
jgi:hypothetical protein